MSQNPDNTKPRLFQRTIGSGSQHLILIHGFGFNSAIWEPILPDLISRYTVTVIDLPGYGQSAALEDYTLDAIVELLNNDLPPHAIVCGWSLGGIIAQAYAQRYPEQVQGLILIASSPYLIEDDEWPGISIEQFETFHIALEQHFPHQILHFLRRHLLQTRLPLHHQESLLNALLEQGLPDKTSAIASSQLIRHIDLRKTAGHLTCPQLYILGQDDLLLPTTNAAENIRQYVPNATIEILPNTGHTPFLSNPSAFINVLMTFIESWNKKR